MGAFFILAAILVSLALLPAGIVFIVRRKRNRKYLWIGLGCLALFLLSLPFLWVFYVLAALIIFGGSFS